MFLVASQLRTDLLALLHLEGSNSNIAFALPMTFAPTTYGRRLQIIGTQRAYLTLLKATTQQPPPDGMLMT